MTLRTLDDIGDVAGAQVFLRADFNVPMHDGAVADDARIRATIPTIRELRERGASLVIASHLGRPKGAVVDGLRLAPVGDALGALLDVDVMALDGVTGTDVEAACGHIEPGEVVLLENLRFDAGEESNDVRFAGALAELADAYVDDAFGAVHRDHASVVALPELMRASGRVVVAGRLLEREVHVLSTLLHDPERPYVAVLGGAKISDKLGVLDALVDRVDALLIGGAMAFTLIAAEQGEIGNSLVEPDRFDQVTSTKKRAAERGVQLEVPVDVIAAAEASADAERSTVPATEIPSGLMGLDIGPVTIEVFSKVLEDAKTILWNGPMGVFEIEAFGEGTRAIAKAVANADAFSVVGGGDTLLAIRQASVEGAIDHLSTGGGASLEFLEGRTLPGIAVLEDA